MTQPQGRGRRSRIVIDVESVQAESRARGARRFGRGRRLLPLALLGGVLLLLFVIAYAWWQGFKASPPYSLALLVDAAQHDDVRAVESFINADEIAQGFVPQIINSLAGAGSPLPPQTQASLNTVLPQLLPRVRETMRDEIAREVKSFSKDDSSRLPFFVKALGVRQATTVTTRGDAATVALKAGDRPVELSMRREGEHWKVITVNDPQLASEIAARLASSLPAAPQQSPQPHGPARRRGTRQ